MRASPQVWCLTLTRWVGPDRSMDFDNGGFLTFSEFLAATVHINAESLKHNMIEAFKSIDKDHDGSITLDEMKKVLESSFSPEEVQNFLQGLDSNGDGVVDLAEFEQLLD